MADPKEKRATTHEGLRVTNQLSPGRQTLYDLVEQLPFPSCPFEERAWDRRGPDQAVSADRAPTNTNR